MAGECGAKEPETEGRWLQGAGDWLHFTSGAKQAAYDADVRTVASGQWLEKRAQTLPSKTEGGAPERELKLENGNWKREEQPVRWYWIAAIWLGLGLFDATQTVMVMRAEGMHHAWVNLFITQVVTWVPWAVATGFVLRLGREHRLNGFTAWSRHLAAVLAIGLVASAWTAGIEEALKPYAPDYKPGTYLHLWQSKFISQLLASVILYGCILLVGWMLESRERLARQEMEAAKLNEQLARAQLSALRQQIEPHFLFNTLNTIAGLVREGRSDGAVDMIAGLSDLLRRSLATSGQQLVQLGEELEIVKKYLEIEQARFAERLRVNVDVPAELNAARVPSLILQPIVENAVKHGIAKRARGGAIAIRATRVNGALTLEVYNDGPGFPEDWEKKTGAIGLANVQERLKSLCGREAALNVVSREDEGTSVRIVLPLQRSGE